MKDLRKFVKQTKNTTVKAAVAPTASTARVGTTVKIKYKKLISNSMPSEITVPLHSSDPAEVNSFRIRLDNHLFDGHPNVKKVIKGVLDNPLQYHDGFMQLMRTQYDNFKFDPRKTQRYLSIVAEKQPDLMPQLDLILDNGSEYDGYRPVNEAIYSQLVCCLTKNELYMLRRVESGDGIGLRNLIWNKLQGGTSMQRRIKAMQTPMNLSDIYYQFQPDGIDKYFSLVHQRLAKLENLGRTMDTMSIMSQIFQHMGQQCLEYSKVIDEQRKDFIKDEKSVTLHSLQSALETVESSNGLGTTSKGTPIPKPVLLSPAPQEQPLAIPAKNTTIGASGGWRNSPATVVNEMNAVAHYGPSNSHNPGACLYPGHRKATNHCYYGCSKCGGCFFYHKRKRLIEQGCVPCDHPMHKYAVHLKQNCELIHPELANKRRPRGGGRTKRRRSPSPNRQRGGGRYNPRNQQNDRYRGRPNHNRDDRRYRPNDQRVPAKQSQYFDRVNKFGRSRSRSRSPRGGRYYERRDDRHDDRRPPPRRDDRQYRDTHDRDRNYHDQRDRNDRYREQSPRDDGHQRPRANGRDTRPPERHQNVSAFKVNVPDRHQSNGRQAGRYMPGKNDDGWSDKWLIPVLKSQFGESNNTPHNRLVEAVASGGVHKMTVLDSAAGKSVFDDDSLYEPSSKRKIAADVVWGDGSTHLVKYQGRIGPLDDCVNTGGAADANLVSLPSAIDSLQRRYKRKITMIFDDAAAYIFKDLSVEPHPRKRGRFVVEAHNSASGMQTATRQKQDAGIYVVPFDNEQIAWDAPSAEHTAQLTQQERDMITPAFTASTVFNKEVEIPTRNQSNMIRELQRLHNCWSHPGKEAMRKMLLQSGTQRHRRLARKVHDLQPQCNCCLEGMSNASPHIRDKSQPTSKATRALQRVCSDCTGTSNIPSLSGALIAFIIVCQFSKYMWLWMLQSTAQVTNVVKKWLRSTIKQARQLRTNPDKAIEFWRSDNGPEFPPSFTQLLDKHSIEHERTGSKASQQNGDSESMLNIIQDKSRASLAFARAPRQWFGEAYMHTCVAHNHTCRAANPDGAAPITVMYGRRPDINKLKPFGCLAFIHVPAKSRKGKLNKAAHHGALMGYVIGSDGRILAYRVYDFDTASFKHPYDVKFNVDVPAVPYIASLKLLAPPVRLIKRTVMKKWGGSPYYGKIICTRTDTDGQMLYGVKYSDNDYEEYSFTDVLKYLQPYDPFDNEDDCVEITPFFGSSTQNLKITDDTDTPSAATQTQPVSKTASSAKSSKASKPKPRRSARVKVVRKIYNAQRDDDDDTHIATVIDKQHEVPKRICSQDESIPNSSETKNTVPHAATASDTST